MTDNRALLDAFAEARSSWDDLIGLQPDIYAGGGHLENLDMAELTRRVKAHQAAMDTLSDVLDVRTVDDGSSPNPSKGSGISNRQSAKEEEADRHARPPIYTGSPAPRDAAGRVGEEPLDDTRDRQTSHKAGSRSVAQKQARSRYPDRPMPASRKVGGAFGREPKD